MFAVVLPSEGRHVSEGGWAKQAQGCAHQGGTGVLPLVTTLFVDERPHFKFSIIDYNTCRSVNL